MKNYSHFFLCYIIATVYVIFVLILNQNIFIETPHAYYSYLLDAFFHGRLNVISPNTYDLSNFLGKWYLYWGPAPVLFILPFYLAGGIHVSDIFYTLVAGILNVFLFFLVIKEFEKYFKVVIPYWLKFIITLHFAFASPNFHLALMGKVWQTNQIIAIFYLLIFFLFYLKWLGKKQELLFLFIAVLFFNFAWLSRYTMVFYGLFFLYTLISYDKLPKALLKKAAILVVFFTGFFFSAFFLYNYLRFNNVFETGVSYQKANIRFAQLQHEGKLFSPSNVPHNVWHYFVNPITLSFEKPFLNIDPEGNSVFFVYPLLLFLPWVIRRAFFEKKRNQLFFLISFLVVGASLTSLLLLLGTGWMQFGNRYFFDIIVPIFLLFLFILKEVPISLQIIVLVYGMIINYIGVFAFSTI